MADFCRARQGVCFRSTSVPQVALLQSAETYWDQADGAPFGRAASREETKGALFALLALHDSVDILAEHQIFPWLRDFPVVVIPDAHRLADEFRRALLDYVEAGGSLVLLGEKSARLFEPELGVKFEGPPSQGAVIGSGPASVSWTNGWQTIAPVAARPLAQRRLTAEAASPATPAATITLRGKGRIAAVYGPVAAKYVQTNAPAIRELIGTVMREAFPQPLVQGHHTRRRRVHAPKLGNLHVMGLYYRTCLSTFAFVQCGCLVCWLSRSISDG